MYFFYSKLKESTGLKIKNKPTKCTN